MPARHRCGSRFERSVLLLPAALKFTPELGTAWLYACVISTLMDLLLQQPMMIITRTVVITLLFH